jgi:hypothetical protein
MLRFEKARDAWGTPDFDDALKSEIERVFPDALPLQRALALTSQVADDPCKAMILGIADDAKAIRAKVGIFYSGIIAGCNCADDPTPVEALPEYCELLFEIDKATAETRVESCSS